MTRKGHVTRPGGSARAQAQPSTPPRGRDDHDAWSVFVVFLRLGLTSFGGPIAHLGFFRNEFVLRRAWLGEQSYADLVALCQLLPGPASSQVGMALGRLRAGYAGALAAWLGFTAPSAIALISLADGIAAFGGAVPAGALHGLKIVTVAVVVQAVWGMARNACTDKTRVTVMAAATCIGSLVPTIWGQVAVITTAGLVGLLFLRQTVDVAADEFFTLTSRRAGLALLTAFVVLLVGLPLLAHMTPSRTLAVVDAFYRAGSLVFGGGHVVLPLLQSEVVPRGWVDNDAFLAGYGATQAVPGPLFAFAAFLGASMRGTPSGWAGGATCVIAIFAPSFLLVMGALPFWNWLRRDRRVRSGLAGINAAVVGLLVAALYQPIWTSAILGVRDFVFAVVALVALVVWRCPPWLVVAGCGATGAVLGV